MRILAIDPGNIESGYAVINMPDFEIITFGKVSNEELKSNLYKGVFGEDDIVIEMVGCYGMPVGKDVFDTCVWIGRFAEAVGKEVHYIYRNEVKIALCGSMKAKDSNVRQALINRYAKFDYKSGKGVKKNPDTFYGVANDMWQAIAVGVTYYEKEIEGIC